MAVTGEDPTLGSAPRPRQRFGPDLSLAWPRPWRWVASRWRRRGSAALSSRRSGGSRRLSSCGSGRGLSAAGRLVERVAVGGLALALASLFGLAQFDPLASWRRSFSARSRSAGSPDAEQRIWAAAGAALRRRACREPWAAQGEPELRPGGDFMALRGRLGSGYRGLFRRPADRRARGFGRAYRRARPGPERSSARSPGPSSASSLRAGRTASRRCSGSGSRRRLSPNSATCSNPPSNGVSASRIRAASSPATAD